MPDAKLESAMRAVRLYYLQDRTMDAIARDLHTSRSSVSRLLSFAREQGLIEFHLHNPDEAGPMLEGQIGERFGVRASLVPTSAHETEFETMDHVAREAGRVISSLFESDMILALAWGTTLTAVSHQLTAKVTLNSQVVQLNGAGNNYSSGIEYASEILRRFGSAYGATVEQFPVPTYFDHLSTKEALWQERSIQRVLDLQRRADMVVFGVGAFNGPIPSHLYTSAYFERADMDELAKEGVVGDVASIFLRSDGTWRDLALNARSSGPDLEQLSRVGVRLCVVSGSHRVAGLRAALRAGLVTDLVIDERTAAALLASARLKVGHGAH